MPIEDYPTHKNGGDRVWMKLRERLGAQRFLDGQDIAVIADFLAAVYQKSLELQFIVKSMLRADPNDKAELAELLSTAEIAAGVLAQWHARSATKLLAAVDFYRTRQESPTCGKLVSR